MTLSTCRESLVSSVGRWWLCSLRKGRVVELRMRQQREREKERSKHCITSHKIIRFNKVEETDVRSSRNDLFWIS